MIKMEAQTPDMTESAANIAEIALPLGVEQPYSYAIPAGMEIAPGDCVLVPLGTRQTYGIVWDVRRGVSGGNLKPIAARTSMPPLRPEMRHFIQRVSDYTLAPVGMVARMAMRDPEAEAHEAPKFGVRLTGKPPARLTPARARVIEAAKGGLVHKKRDLAERAACSTGVIDALVDDGVFDVVALAPEARANALDPAGRAPVLSEEQAEAAEGLCAAVIAGGFAPFLLEGVTGSGKTEVYFESVAAALEAKRQVLILLPEIALTPEFLARFEARFGGQPGAWHSGIAPGRRDRLWHAVAEGEARVVVGARSALFLPFAELGLIVVDEEHEAAFKQDDQVRYNARDMAVLRAKIETCAVVLASATPSIESRVNVQQGRYRHLTLPNRVGGRAMPDISAIDLTLEAPDPGKFLSPRLIREAAATLARGEQVLFFLNRRGYAPLTLCRACGHRWQCPQCDAWLVEHRFRRALVCHHCGHTERRPTTCVACGAEESLTACGPGVERIAEEVAEAFPDVRRITLSSDFPGGTERLRQELAAVAANEFPIIIGTQLIAKGHNFPHLTLAAVVDADIGLVSNDPRAAERTFQLLAQVTGRAGRGDRPGRGLLQTYQPRHPVIAALLSGDHERFYAEEIAARSAAGLPPYGRLASLVVSAREKPAAEAHARLLAQVGHREIRALGLGDREASLLGPAEPPMALLRGRHRIRLILKTSRQVNMQGLLRAMVREAGPAKGGARVDVDVDPFSFF
ncbi:MAG: primosomal protein [Beijerinckiaceae bacterium]|nr:MAG: primosomal protein [Beijerinckiaceae bacterium]